MRTIYVYIYPSNSKPSKWIFMTLLDNWAVYTRILVIEGEKGLGGGQNTFCHFIGQNGHGENSVCS
jgi:hypothetical protein